MKVVPLAGGPARDLWSMGDAYVGDLIWAPDSRSVLSYVAAQAPAADNRMLWWLPIDGRLPRQLDLDPRLASEARADHIRLHPDGRRLVFLQQPASLDPGGPRTSLWVLDNPFAVTQR